ncbi:protein of unknown function [Paraburkholderia dioscoreae]|uniref:Uncharacterized protein n=1 Tax=Paraburkholderia dioscoreae TaxID=2604047 RepID=A0A5Q4YW50_9BURK|nr:protein of unknown function [Paraburkholderia dioscoreae]
MGKLLTIRRSISSLVADNPPRAVTFMLIGGAFPSPLVLYGLSSLNKSVSVETKTRSVNHFQSKRYFLHGAYHYAQASGVPDWSSLSYARRETT